MEEGKVNTPVEQAPVAPMAPAEEKKKSNGLIIGLVLLALVALGGIGFGVWQMMQGSDKDKQIIDLKTQVANCANANNNIETETETVTCPDGTATEIVKNAIDNASAQTIADPYLVHFGAFDNIFDHDFDISAKMKIAFDNLGANKVVMATMVGEWAITVQYDDLNSEYKYLFGSDQEIEKRDYESLYGDFTFTEEQGERFKVSLGGVGGTGATMFSVVKSAKYEDDNLIIDVYHDRAHWCESEDQIGNDYCVKAYSVPKSEAINDFIKDFADKIPVYTMTFAKDDGHYVLKDIKKQ